LFVRSFFVRLFEAEAEEEEGSRSQFGTIHSSTTTSRSVELSRNKSQYLEK